MYFERAIFDLDGTLLNSMDIWEHIDFSFLKKRNIMYPVCIIQGFNFAPCQSDKAQISPITDFFREGVSQNKSQVGNGSGRDGIMWCSNNLFNEE